LACKFDEELLIMDDFNIDPTREKHLKIGN